MTRAFLCCTVVLVLAMAAAIAPATAQFPPPPPTSAAPANAPPLAGTPKKKPTPPGPNIAGNWSGQLTQVDNQAPYKFELAVSAKGAETKHPDLDWKARSSPLLLPLPMRLRKRPAHKWQRRHHDGISAAPCAPHLWIGNDHADALAANYGVLGLYWDWKIHPLPGAATYAAIFGARSLGSANSFLAPGLTHNYPSMPSPNPAPMPVSSAKRSASPTGRDTGGRTAQPQNRRSAASRPFGAVPSHDGILLGREQAAPFLVAAGDFETLCVHSFSPQATVGSKVMATPLMQ